MHLALPPAHRVEQQAQVAEVELAFGSRLAVGDPHRCRGGAAITAAFGAEPVQRPVGNHDTAALQQHPDLDDRQAPLDPPLDLGVAGLQLLPPQPVPARPHRADHLRDLADQLISQLSRAAVAGQPGLHRRLDIPAGGLTIHPRLRGHPAQTCTGQPRPEHLTDLVHGNLPECHPQNPQVDRLEGTGYRK
jgi:hypothetical protein